MSHPRKSPKAAFGVALAGSLLVLAALPPLSGVPTGQAVWAAEADQKYVAGIIQLLELGINQPDVAVEVFVLPGENYVAVLSGILPPPKAGQDPKEQVKRLAVAALKKHHLDAKVHLNLDKLQVRTVKDVEDEKSNPITRELIPLTIVPGGTGSAVSSQVAMELLTTILNAVYGTDKKPVAFHDRYNLWIKAPKRTVLQIRSFIHSLDAPAPQVQLEMWAVQVSGDADRVSEETRDITRDIRDTREHLHGAHIALLKVLKQNSALFNNDKLFNKLEAQGFVSSVDRPLSLIEALVFLGLSEERDQLAKALANEYSALGKSIGVQPFRRLQQALSKDQVDADRAGVEDFVLALEGYSSFLEYVNDTFPMPPTGLKEEHLPFLEQQPAELNQQAAAVDRLLKGLMDTWTADMQELFLQPLLSRIQKRQIRGGGVALGGTTRISVAHRADAFLRPEVVAFVDATLPRPFGTDLLDATHPKVSVTPTTEVTEVTAPDGSVTKTTKTTPSSANRAPGGDALGQLSGLQQLLAPLPQAQALLLGSAILSDVQPRFTSVAPGVEVKVVPSVLPDEQSARLQLNFRFGVETSVLGEERPDLKPARPADAVKSHQVVTDTTVTAFDLFDVSSFSLATSHPQAPHYIPILGRLPLIGPVFQLPRGNKRTHHESVILANAVIQPRSLYMTRFYQGGPIGPGATPAKPSDVQGFKSGLNTLLENRVKKQ